MEHSIHTHIIQHCDTQNILQKCQHGFRKQHTCESQLIITKEELKRSIDRKKQVDVIILAFSKAFNAVAHNKLMGQSVSIQRRPHTLLSQIFFEFSQVIPQLFK